MRKQILAACLILAATIAQAQQKELTYGQIFSGAATNLDKPLPMITSWQDDEHYIEQRKDPADGGKLKLMLVDVKTGNAIPYNPPAKDPQAAKGTVVLRNNDIFYSYGDTATRQLTTTADKEVNPVLSPDGSRVAFTRNNNLFTLEIASGKETQHTTDGSELILNGHASWVYFEEILGRAGRYRAFWWSPDGKQLGFMRFDDTEVPLFYIYNNEGQHGFNEKTRYPKAGDKNPEVKVGLVDLATSKTVWADFNPKDDQYFGTPIWTPSGKFWVQWMNRDQNNLKIFEIEPGSGAKKEVYDEKQTTWIDLDDNDRIEFLPDG
ncbi:MAG: DPP IV N-terminal domain-containing protein, partial [Gemmatimonadaceae bacterium]|nr:DPP IV N-terminal domain-containing protein [Chitinophagaceae bacterium]